MKCPVKSAPGGILLFVETHLCSRCGLENKRKAIVIKEHSRLPAALKFPVKNDHVGAEFVNHSRQEQAIAGAGKTNCDVLCFTREGTECFDLCHQLCIKVGP